MYHNRLHIKLITMYMHIYMYFKSFLWGQDLDDVLTIIQDSSPSSYNLNVGGKDNTIPPSGQI